MKKLFGLALCICLLLSLAIPASASAGDTRLLEYDHIDTVTANLTINRTWNIATCDGSIEANGTYPVHVDVALQQYTSNGWETLKVWSNSGQDAVEAGGSYAVPKGYQYRTYTVGFVYDGNGNIIDCASATYGFTFE